MTTTTTSGSSSQRDQGERLYTAFYTITEGPGTVMIFMQSVDSPAAPKDEDSVAGDSHTTPTTTSSTSASRTSTPSQILSSTSSSFSTEILRSRTPAATASSIPQTSSAVLPASPDLSPGAKAGLAIGIILAVFSLVASMAAIWLILHRHGPRVRTGFPPQALVNKDTEAKEPLARRVRVRKPPAYSFLPRKVPRDRVAELHNESRPQEMRTGMRSPAELQAF